MKQIKIKVKNNEFIIGGSKDLKLITGPCAIESLDHSMFMAEKINNICYDKDCLSSPDSFHGVWITEGLRILEKVRNEFEIPVTSDFSDPMWAKETGEVCDIVQVPAYLCRQTSILKAAAETNKPINIKKGQFMSPWNMKNSVKKVEYYGNEQIILTDRGTFFGYNMLVNDMRSLPIMRETGYPVCFDATHSVQQPTSMGNISGGQREFIPHLVRASCATGIDVLFLEVHDNPKNALSDKNTVLDLKFLERVLTEAKSINDIQSDLEDKYGKEYIKHESWKFDC